MSRFKKFHRTSSRMFPFVFFILSSIFGSNMVKTVLYICTFCRERPKAKLSSELNGHFSKSRLIVEDDPFLAFESSVSQADASWPSASPSELGKGYVYSSLDDLDEFAACQPQNDSRTNDTRTKTERPRAGTASNAFQNVDFLDAIFSGGKQQDHAARPTSTTVK